MLTWRHLRLTKNELYLQSDNHYFPSECYSTSAYLPLQIGMLFFVLGHWVCLHTLHKIPWFHLVSWCGSFRANHTKIAFPQIFHTRKLGEISVFYAILFTLIIVPNHQISLHYKMILTITIMRWWLWIALLALFYQPLIEPRIISPITSTVRCSQNQTSDLLWAKAEIVCSNSTKQTKNFKCHTFLTQLVYSIP